MRLGAVERPTHPALPGTSGQRRTAHSRRRATTVWTGRVLVPEPAVRRFPCFIVVLVFPGRTVPEFTAPPTSALCVYQLTRPGWHRLAHPARWWSMDRRCLPRHVGGREGQLCSRACAEDGHTSHHQFGLWWSRDVRAASGQSRPHVWNAGTLSGSQAIPGGIKPPWLWRAGDEGVQCCRQAIAPGTPRGSRNLRGPPSSPGTQKAS